MKTKFEFSEKEAHSSAEFAKEICKAVSTFVPVSEKEIEKALIKTKESFENSYKMRAKNIELALNYDYKTNTYVIEYEIAEEGTVAIIKMATGIVKKCQPIFKMVAAIIETAKAIIGDLMPMAKELEEIFEVPEEECKYAVVLRSFDILQVHHDVIITYCDDGYQMGWTAINFVNGGELNNDLIDELTSQKTDVVCSLTKEQAENADGILSAKVLKATYSKNGKRYVYHDDGEVTIEKLEK